MAAKSNKVDLSEEFMGREEQTVWDVMFPLYPDKNEKGKSFKRMSDNFQIFSDCFFTNNVLFQMRNLFSVCHGDS